MKSWILVLLAGLAGCTSTKITPPILDDASAPCTEGEISVHCANAPQSTFGAEGALWVVWAQGQYLYVSHSLDKGLSYAPAVKVNRVPEQIASRGESRPHIVVDKDSNVFVTWNQVLEKKYSGFVRFSRSLDGGKTFSKPVTVNDDKQIIAHRFETLAINEAGDLYIAWLDKRDSTREPDAHIPMTSALYFSQSIDRGESFSKNAKLVDSTCVCCRLALGIDQDDRPVVMWRHVFENNIRDHAIARLNAEADIQRVSVDGWQFAGCPHHGPDLSIGSNGVRHAVWFTGEANKRGLYYANAAPPYHAFSQPTPFGGQGKMASHPSVLASPQRLIVSWREFNGQDYSLWVMESGNDGQSFNEPVRIAQTRGDADYGFLKMDKSHGVSKYYLQWKTSDEGLRLFKL